MSETGESRRDPARSSLRAVFSVGYGTFLFGVGLGLGMFLAFSGQGFIFARLSVVLTAFLVAAMILSALGLLLLVFRRRLLTMLFDAAETELASLAAPMTDFARTAARRDEDGMAAAGRTLLEMLLARYAVISGRRWMIGSLTALVAALAALAGTTLLFRQNELIGEQARRLNEQNILIADQTRRIETTIELSEAQRSAGLLPEISDLAAALADATAEASGKGLGPPFDLASDIPPGLVDRIVLASLAARPYRYLEVARPALDQRAALRAAAALRPDLTRFAAAMGVPDRPGDGVSALIADPVSPERGLLVALLYNNGVHDLSALAARGADLSFAEIRLARVLLARFRYLTLSQARFSGATLIETGFGGATLYGARFDGTIIRRSDFAAVPGAEVPPPFGPLEVPMPAWLTGADFSGAFVHETRFDGSSAQFVRFRGAFLADVSFAGTALDGADFTGTVLLETDFTGASLRSADFDGALVFEADFLGRLTREAEAGTFRADRYVIETAGLDDVWAVEPAFDHVGAEVPLERVEALTPWRIRRVAPFEPPPEQADP